MLIDNCQASFHRGCAIYFYIFARWYLSMILICFLLLSNWASLCMLKKHLFSFSVIIHIFCPFLTEFYSFLGALYILGRLALYDMNYKPFSQVHHLYFDFANGAYLVMQNFMFIALSIFPFVVPRISHSNKGCPTLRIKKFIHLFL